MKCDVPLIDSGAVWINLASQPRRSCASAEFAWLPGTLYPFQDALDYMTDKNPKAQPSHDDKNIAGKRRTRPPPSSVTINNRQTHLRERDQREID
jgi:hypothetical protein